VLLVEIKGGLVDDLEDLALVVGLGQRPELLEQFW
jgi:hypothetical protein